MSTLAPLTARGGPVEPAEFPLSARLNPLQYNGFPFDRSRLGRPREARWFRDDSGF